MSSIPDDAARRKVIIGVDTHKHIHVVVAIDQHGARLGVLSVSADTGGYTQLEQWARALGRVDRFGIEGTGSYGARCAGTWRSLSRHGTVGSPNTAA